MKITTALLSALLFAASAQANLVTNGNFETGNFTGWTKSGNPGLSDVISNTVTSNHTFLWRNGATGSPAFISQNLVTSAGNTYDLSFDVYNSSTASTSTFEVWFNGIEVYQFIGEVHNWSHLTFSGLVATGASTELKFGARNDPSFTRLDNVEVDLASTAPVTVPEPGSLALLAVALAAAGATLRRRQVG